MSLDKLADLIGAACTKLKIRRETVPTPDAYTSIIFKVPLYGALNIPEKTANRIAEAIQQNINSAAHANKKVCFPHDIKHIVILGSKVSHPIPISLYIQWNHDACEEDIAIQVCTV